MFIREHLVVILLLYLGDFAGSAHMVHLSLKFSKDESISNSSVEIEKLNYGFAVYGSDPSFVFSTATSANPREHCMVKIC